MCIDAGKGLGPLEILEETQSIYKSANQVLLSKDTHSQAESFLHVLVLSQALQQDKEEPGAEHNYTATEGCTSSTTKLQGLKSQKKQPDPHIYPTLTLSFSVRTNWKGLRPIDMGSTLNSNSRLLL